MDHAAVKLGRVKPTAEQKAKAMPLMKYVKGVLPVAPPEFDGVTGAKIAMFGNDRYGDCTFAGVANLLMICAKHEGREIEISEQQVIDAYLTFTDGQDEGAVETDVLALLTSVGVQFGIDVEKIAVWASVPVRDFEACKSLMSVFWALYLGVSLPVSAQNQEVWDVGPNTDGDFAPGSWGGHCLLAGIYKADNELGLVTWGEVQRATLVWFETYVDEVYVLLDAARAEQIGVDWDALLKDMAAAQAL